VSLPARAYNRRVAAGAHAATRHRNSTAFFEQGLSVMAETGMAGQTVALAAVLAAGTFLLYFLKHVLDAVRAWHDE
jgi:hypothetical protein